MPRSACPRATGARPGPCWARSGSILTSWRGPCWPSRPACPRRTVRSSQMKSSDSGGGKVFGRFAEPAHQVLDLAREEAERYGHRYLGPEHVLLGTLVESQSRAAQLLRSHGLEVTAARAALARLAVQRVVPGPRPSDAQLLGTLGIDLDAVRRDSEQTFGVRAVGEATWRVTRRRGWRGRRVVWTPLCGPPLFAKRALQLASDQAHALGHDEVRPEHLLLGVLEDAGQPAETGEGRGGTGGSPPTSACPRAIGGRPGCCWRPSRLIWTGCGMRSSSLAGSGDEPTGTTRVPGGVPAGLRADRRSDHLGAAPNRVIEQDAADRHPGAGGDPAGRPGRH